MAGRQAVRVILLLMRYRRQIERVHTRLILLRPLAGAISVKSVESLEIQEVSCVVPVALNKNVKTTPARNPPMWAM